MSKKDTTPEKKNQTPPAQVHNLINQELANDYYEKLAQWIIDFEAELDEEHEVGVRLVSFGDAVTFTLTDIGYHDPSLICFMGETEEGEPVELIQHVNQISILLMKQKIQDPEVAAAREPIGFRLQARKQQKA